SSMSLLSTIPLPPNSTIFPYTTLFRSEEGIDVKKYWMKATMLSLVALSLAACGGQSGQKNEDPSGEQAVTQTSMPDRPFVYAARSEEHTSELQSRFDLVCPRLLEKTKE